MRGRIQVSNGIGRSVRVDGDEAVGLQGDPQAEALLEPDQVAEDAPLLAAEVVAGDLQLLDHHGGDDRGGDQLPVGVRVGGAGVAAPVLEQQRVAQARVAAQVLEAGAAGDEGADDLVHGEVRGVAAVIGALDDDLVRAHPRQPVVEGEPLPGDLALDPEHREAVRNHPHLPVGAAARRLGSWDDEDLGRSAVLLAVLERAAGDLGQRVGWPLGDHQLVGS